jgi:hypothetical protein
MYAVTIGKRKREEKEYTEAKRMGQIEEGFKPKSAKQVAGEIHSSYVSLYVTGFYFVYLQLTKKALGVFGCTPTDDKPPRFFMDMAPEEECYMKGGTHLKLLPLAPLCSGVYGLDFPMSIIYNLRVHRYVIEYDQLLRALDTGFTYETNPYFDYREGFQRMYDLFKPKRFYWICCILLRKISIALVALWFKRVPTFQLALALFIMFSASCAQYVFAPYMAMKDREEVIREHLEEEERVEQALRLTEASIFGVQKDEDGDGIDDTLQRRKSEFVVAVGKKKEKKLKNKKMPKLPYDQAHQRHYAELTKRV